MEKREDSQGSESLDEEEEAEARQRRRLAGRTDVLGIDGLALFCLIWVITMGARHLKSLFKSLFDAS